ncbi:phage tail-collar fiber domain-containing protein [Burkholderia sp. TSV86]|uniref:phage tail-collar fiber domain-containing protein n=1 Tax=Burkholderia sp. TSV86 TaxID=1385594 RepID=UPI00075A3D24|nr:phage tail protein [Burkholderia sp. TSV86]KVE33903.1 phage tail protein [Burkholderia sp. TSV86]
MRYKTIHTNYGLRRMTQAEATGTSINLVAVSVGDGGGNPTTPDRGQTQLIREMFRTAPNRVYQDPQNPVLFVVEMVIPATMGGFTIREMAAWDDQGGMFAVANVPDVYKPQGDGSEGSFGDTVLRMEFLATNADMVTIQIDPNVAVATQAWVNNAITLPYLLKGGHTGQILAKKSNADGDVSWQDPTTANVTVSTVDEVQTLADGQTAVTLTKCSTIGLAIYIEGSRLLPTEWTADSIDRARLMLARSYPAGSRAYFVQNDPAAFVPAPLIQSKNLSDVPDVGVARANLGVDSKVNTDTHAPPGMIMYFAAAVPPPGWMKANGAAVSRTTYAALFFNIGTTHGAGDGFNTFNLPDLRGEFIRGWDDGRGVDGGRQAGSRQGSQNLAHAHWASSDVQGRHTHGVNDPGHSHQMNLTNNTNLSSGSGAPGLIGTIRTEAAATGITIQLGGDHYHNITINPDGGNESRPRNVALLACIKY